MREESIIYFAWLYVQAMGTILRLRPQKERLIMLKEAALITAIHSGLRFLSEGIMPDICETMVTKKVQFLIAAKSQKEIKDILQIQKPKYDSSGKIGNTSPYYIAEEELAQWAVVSPNHCMVDAANNRYYELIEQVLGKVI